MVVVCAALLTGCAGPVQKPEIRLAGVELVGLGLAEQRLLLKLSIANPNDVDWTIKALSFDLELNGLPLAKGGSERPVVVARHAETLLEVKAVSRLGDVLKQLPELRKTGAGPLGYRLYGRVDVDGYGSLPFERSGQLPRAALERFGTN